MSLNSRWRGAAQLPAVRLWICAHAGTRSPATLGEPQRMSLADALKLLKQGVSRRLHEAAGFPISFFNKVPKFQLMPRGATYRPDKCAFLFWTEPGSYSKSGISPKSMGKSGMLAERGGFEPPVEVLAPTTV